MSPSTVLKKIRYIDGFYNNIDLHWGNQRLDDALSDLDLQSLCDMLEGYFVSLQDERKLTAATEERWQTVLQFVIETCQRIARSKASSARVHDLESRLADLQFQAAHLYVGKRKRAERVRSLPANVLEFLYKTLDPECSNNPFRRGNTRWRVWTLFVLLLHQGLRRGEALILPTDAIRHSFDTRGRSNRFWMDVRFNEYEDDPRFSKPSIKNAQSLRQIPVSRPIALLVQEYSENYRGRANHAFLFNSQKHLHLSKEGVEWLFLTLSASLPSSLQKEMRDHTELPPSISPGK